MNSHLANLIVMYAQLSAIIQQILPLSSAHGQPYWLMQATAQHAAMFLPLSASVYALYYGVNCRICGV